MGLISQFLIISLSGQSLRDNLQKYWYYRNRLANFVKVSSNYNEAGTNYPATEIHTLPQYTEDQIYFDDGNSVMNHYISVLATEYRLLKNYNQDYTQTAQQLYYALMSINRLDATAESYYGGTANNLNGFFVRNDETKAFWDKYGKLGSTPYFKVQNFGGKFDPKYPNAWNNEMSEDNVTHYLEALSLVNTLVDNETVDGTAVNFKQIAKDIAKRMIDFMYHPNDKCTYDYRISPSSPFILQETFNWYVKNPVTKKFVPQGSGIDDGSMYLFSYGYTKVAKSIYGDATYQAMDMSETITNEMIKAPMNDLQIKLNLTEYLCVPLVTSTSLTELKLQILGANYSFNIFNIKLGYELIDLCTQLYKTESKSLKDISWDDYKVRSLCAVGNINTDGKNTYQSLILKQQQNTVATYEHLPLLWSVLQNDYSNITQTDRNIILNLLNSAPACGPYYFDGSHNGGDWSSDSRLVWPENNRTGSNHGEFNGLDYMLLHNLYWLSNPVIVPKDFRLYTDDVRFPQVPFSITASNNIYCEQPVTQNGNTIQLYAGNSVELDPGFQITGSGNFNIDISEVTTTSEKVYYHKLDLSNYNSCPDRLK